MQLVMVPPLGRRRVELRDADTIIDPTTVLAEQLEENILNNAHAQGVESSIPIVSIWPPILAQDSSGGCVLGSGCLQ
jgi:hypothetical protein